MLGRINDVSQKSKILLLAALVLVLIGSGAGLYAAYTDRLSEKSEEQARMLRNDKRRYDIAIQQSNNYRRLRQNDKALEVLQDYAATAKSNEYKIFTYTKIGTIHEVNKEYDKALAAYRQAEKLKGRDDRAIAVGIARSSYALGDKQTAIEYYKKCIAVLEEQNGRLLAEDIELYKKTIADIEAGK